MPGRIVRRATYIQEYHELTHKKGVPFVPNAVWKDIVFSGFILLSIAACAVYFGPFGPSGQPDPTIIQTAPHPDFFFLWLYALLSFLAAVGSETPILLIGPAIGIACAARTSICRGRRREELETQADRSAVDSAYRGNAGHVDPSGATCALEPSDGRLEQPADSFTIFDGTHCTRTTEGLWYFRRNNAATVTHSMTKEESVGRLWTALLCTLLKTN